MVQGESYLFHIERGIKRKKETDEDKRCLNAYVQPCRHLV